MKRWRAAEKQRRYRQRRDRDPHRRQEYLEKEKQRYRIKSAKFGQYQQDFADGSQYGSYVKQEQQD